MTMFNFNPLNITRKKGISLSTKNSVFKICVFFKASVVYLYYFASLWLTTHYSD